MENMKQPPRGLVRTAYHEAGHAVIAYLVKRNIRHMMIVPDGESLGSVTHDPWSAAFRLGIEAGSAARNRRVDAQIMICFAGGLATTILTGRRDWKGADNDLSAAHDLAQYETGSQEEREAYLKWLMIRTEGWLRNPRHWAAVEGLAQELLQKRRLSGQQARDVILACLLRRNSACTPRRSSDAGSPARPAADEA